MAVRVATFNAGLAVGYLSHVTERLPHVVEALSKLDVDVLFVQEFWFDDHWRLLCEALAGKLPHTLRPAPVALSAGGCTAEQLAPLLACASKHCAGLRDEALAACIVRHCAAHGLSLPRGCLNCIARDPRGTIEEITSRCVGDAAHGEHEPGGYDALLAYGGSFGTGLLSRSPLEQPDTLVYRSTINARGAVYAKTGDLHVFGTHFTPGGSDQSPQFDAFIEWADAKAPRGERAVLLGDLNTSSGSQLFKKLVRAGFREPDKIDTRSTCYGSRIDHILVRDVDARVESRRIFDAQITLPDGERTTLSDHYGVLATLG